MASADEQCNETVTNSACIDVLVKCEHQPRMGQGHRLKRQPKHPGNAQLQVYPTLGEYQ